jgi:hypothetical protein
MVLKPLHSSSEVTLLYIMRSRLTQDKTSHFVSKNFSGVILSLRYIYIFILFST